MKKYTKRIGLPAYRDLDSQVEYIWIKLTDVEYQALAKYIPPHSKVENIDA